MVGHLPKEVIWNVRACLDDAIFNPAGLNLIKTEIVNKKLRVAFLFKKEEQCFCGKVTRDIHLHATKGMICGTCIDERIIKYPASESFVEDRSIHQALPAKEGRVDAILEQQARENNEFERETARMVKEFSM
jgi:hypothetical protein